MSKKKLEKKNYFWKFFSKNFQKIKIHFSKKNRPNPNPTENVFCFWLRTIDSSFNPSAIIFISLEYSFISQSKCHKKQVKFISISEIKKSYIKNESYAIFVSFNVKKFSWLPQRSIHRGAIAISQGCSRAPSLPWIENNGTEEL